MIYLAELMEHLQVRWVQGLKSSQIFKQKSTRLKSKCLLSTYKWKKGSSNEQTNEKQPKLFSIFLKKDFEGGTKVNSAEQGALFKDAHYLVLGRF